MHGRPASAKVIHENGSTVRLDPLLSKPLANGPRVMVGPPRKLLDRDHHGRLFHDSLAALIRRSLARTSHAHVIAHVLSPWPHASALSVASQVSTGSSLNFARAHASSPMSKQMGHLFTRPPYEPSPCAGRTPASSHPCAVHSRAACPPCEARSPARFVRLHPRRGRRPPGLALRARRHTR